MKNKMLMQITNAVRMITMLSVIFLTGCKSSSSTMTSSPPIALTIPGIVMYYPFNGNAHNVGENHIDGEIHGASPTTDRFGIANHAYYFDGVDDSIYFDASKMPLGSSARTISAWVKADSFPPAPENFQALGSRATVVGWGKDEDRQLSEMQIFENKLLFHVFNADTASMNSIELGKWHHLVIIYTGQKVILYNNGEKEEYEASELFTQSGKGRIGAFSDPTVKSPLFPNGYDLSYFHGVIDDISIFNRALTYDQVMLLYHEGDWK